MTLRAVDMRIYNDLKFGFKPKNENKELTKKICKVLGITSDILVVDFIKEN